MLVKMDCVNASSGGWKHISTVYDTTQTSTTFDLNNLSIGKVYHLFVTNAGSSVENAITNATLAISSGASNLTIDSTEGFAGTGTYYSSIVHHTFTATASTVSFTKGNQRRLGYMLFEE